MPSRFILHATRNGTSPISLCSNSAMKMPSTGCGVARGLPLQYGRAAARGGPRPRRRPFVVLARNQASKSDLRSLSITTTSPSSTKFVLPQPQRDTLITGRQPRPKPLDQMAFSRHTSAIGPIARYLKKRPAGSHTDACSPSRPVTHESAKMDRQAILHGARRAIDCGSE